MNCRTFRWLRSRVLAVKPMAVMTRDQQELFAAKQRELSAARAFAAAGNYDEAVRRYDAYVAKYPQSAAAIAEREAARHKLVVDMPIADDEITVTKSRPKTKTATTPPPKPPSRWERVKHWFRGT